MPCIHSREHNFTVKYRLRDFKVQCLFSIALRFRHTAVNISEIVKSMPLPVNSYSRHRIYAGEHSGDGEEVMELAVCLSKVPLTMRGVNKIN